MGDGDRFPDPIGKKCDDKRQEFILFSDVMGVSMLVDSINHRLPTGATPTTVEGPFHVPTHRSSPTAPTWRRSARAFRAFITGTVKGLDGRPVANATLDLWQTDGEGLYEAQRRCHGAVDARPVPLQGRRLICHPHGGTDRLLDPDGRSDRRTREPAPNLRHAPGAYPFLHEAPGYHRVVTHLFQRGCPYIETDVVYGVKEPLIVDFVDNPPGKAPNGEQIATHFYTIRYDFVLQPQVAAAAAA